MDRSTDIDKTLQQFNNDKFDLEKRVNDIERSLLVSQRESAMQVDQLKTMVNMNLQQKIDYRDLDNISHQLHTKADVEKV